VNGVRLVYPMEKQAMRFINLIGNKFFSLAFSWLLGQSIKDTLCGTKVLWKKDYDLIAANRAYFGDFDPFGDFDLLFKFQVRYKNSGGGKGAANPANNVTESGANSTATAANATTTDITGANSTVIDLNGANSTATAANTTTTDLTGANSTASAANATITDPAAAAAAAAAAGNGTTTVTVTVTAAGGAATGNAVSHFCAWLIINSPTDRIIYLFRQLPRPVARAKAKVKVRARARTEVPKRRVLKAQPLQIRLQQLVAQRLQGPAMPQHLLIPPLIQKIGGALGHLFLMDWISNAFHRSYARRAIWNIFQELD